MQKPHNGQNINISNENGILPCSCTTQPYPPHPNPSPVQYVGDIRLILDNYYDNLHLEELRWFMKKKHFFLNHLVKPCPVMLPSCLALPCALVGQKMRCDSKVLTACKLDSFQVHSSLITIIPLLVFTCLFSWKTERQAYPGESWRINIAKEKGSNEKGY